MSVGYLAGTFEIFHHGHIKFIQSARLFCDKLIVGVVTDEYALKYKNKPCLNANERMSALKAFGNDCVNAFILHDEDTIKSIYPNIDVLFIGSDYPKTKSHKKGLRLARKYGVRIVVIGRTLGISTTEIKRRIVNDRKV